MTGSGKIIVQSGATLTLTSAMANSGVEIELAGGTLYLGTFTHSIGTLTVSGNSTLDFASAGTAQLTAATLVVNASRTLNVTNWTRASDKFYATAFTGAARNAIGAVPMNQVTMTGYAPGFTVWQSDNEINVLLNPRLRIAKISNGGVGTFSFAFNGLSTGGDSITTAVASVQVLGASGITGTSGVAATVTETAPAGWPANPVSASCLDANGASNANGTTAFGVLVGNVLTVAAGRMIPGADITCAFTSGLNGLSGYVFDDGGAPAAGVNSGTPNDGIRNGGEAGVPGIAVSLTDCSATTYASSNTDGNGAWSLNIPGNVSAGTTVCLSAALPARQIATGASVAGTAVPDGNPTTAGGMAYTYSRASHRLSFAAPASGTATANFGSVARSTFTAASARQGVPGTSVEYPHVFTAGTTGVLTVSVTQDSPTPAMNGWTSLVFADVGCTGKYQNSATRIYPPSEAINVVQGQIYCMILRELVPAAAINANKTETTLQALLTFSNASPSLSASYTLVDTTTASKSPLELQKDVRNITTSGAFSASNQAKSGEVLEYRISYVNKTAAPMTQITLHDSIPAYTTFQSATAATPPAGLGNCTKNTPQNATPAAAVNCATAQAAGGTGEVRWTFDGVLNPSMTGEVSFRVVVD